MPTTVTHYCYRIEFSPENALYTDPVPCYVGVRTCRDVTPEEDPYTGSPSVSIRHWWTLPHRKVILGIYDSREEACDAEDVWIAAHFDKDLAEIWAPVNLSIRGLALGLKQRYYVNDSLVTVPSTFTKEDVKLHFGTDNVQGFASKRKWANNGVELTLVPAEQVLEEGWVEGRGLDKRWIHRGDQLALIDVDAPTPEGWSNGTGKVTKGSTGKRRITNGIDNAQIDQDSLPPDGWWYGITRQSNYCTGLVSYCHPTLKSIKIAPDQKPPEGYIRGQKHPSKRKTTRIYNDKSN